MFAPHQGNGAKGAGVVAAFGNLEVANVGPFAEVLADAGFSDIEITDLRASKSIGGSSRG